MPTSFLSENLKPITSVQNFVLRSISLTLSTTWPIFFILTGDVSSVIHFLLSKSLLKQRISRTDDRSRQNQTTSAKSSEMLLCVKFRNQFTAVGTYCVQVQ